MDEGSSGTRIIDSEFDEGGGCSEVAFCHSEGIS
jgi:hypothetical protein